MRSKLFAVEFNGNTKNSIILGFSDDINYLWSICESRSGYDRIAYRYFIMDNDLLSPMSLDFKDNALLNICKNVAMHLDLFDFRIKKNSLRKAHEGFLRIDKLLKDGALILQQY